MTNEMTSISNTDPFVAARKAMVDSQLRTRGIRDEHVLAAMERVPRHEFIQPEYWFQAYEDHPLPIGEGQTISQPYIVAITLEALALAPSDTVLEIGTGSGYQTAVIAELARWVYSVERHLPLAAQAQKALSSLNVRNATVLVSDGSKGFPEFAPYNAIAVSAAAPRIPTSLLEQLAEGGRMVIPVGPGEAQQLQLVRKQNRTAVITPIEGCRFVPLIGSEGYPGPNF